MANYIVCDKCSSTDNPDWMRNFGRVSIGHRKIDLCGPCYKALEVWIGTAATVPETDFNLACRARDAMSYLASGEYLEDWFEQ
jgi:hypothetical protein